MKKILSVLCCFIVSSCLHAASDTIPVFRTSKGIRINLALAYKGSLQRAKYLSSYSINDFTKSQVDSFLFVLNNDNLVNPYIILSTGFWQMDSEDIHQRLCSFITLDTLDYAGKWGENRRPRFNENEWAARLALARLGYLYHIDFIENIFKEQSVLGHNVGHKLSTYTHYINKNQVTHCLLELALKDYHYSYFDWENFNLGADTVSYYLSAEIMAKTGLPIEIAEEKSYPRKWRSDINDNDIALFKQWIKASREKNITLKKDSLLIRNGHFLSYGISIRPNKQLREKRLASIQQSNRGPKDRPHINYRGACYFEGDTIYVSKHKKEDIWLMAWQSDGRVVGSDTEWQGVSGTEKASYAWLDYKLVPRRKARLVSFRATANDGEAVRMAVYVMKRA